MTSQQQVTDEAEKAEDYSFVENIVAESLSPKPISSLPFPLSPSNEPKFMSSAIGELKNQRRYELHASSSQKQVFEQNNQIFTICGSKYN